MKNDDLFSFRPVSQGEIRGWVKEDITPLLPPSFFEDPVSSALVAGAHVIKEARVRWAGVLPLPNGTGIFLKRDRSKGWFEYLKYVLFPSRGRKEWLTAYQLQKKNVNIPRPLGWMERRRQRLVKESYYISEAVGSGVPYIEDAVQLANRDSIVQLARAVKKIHDSGLLHKDFHAGNFLWDGKSFVLSDLHGAKIVRSLSLNQKLWMLSHLFHSLRSRWSEEDQRQFIDAYLEGQPRTGQKKEEGLRAIHHRMDHLQKRQWRSRTKRCLKESTEFTIEKTRGVVYYHRRDLPPDQIERVVQEHQRLVREEPSALLKNSPIVIVSMVKSGETKFCVKQFFYSRGWAVMKEWFRRPKGLRAWIGGNGLRARGVPAVQPLALVEMKQGSGGREHFFLMEALDHGHEGDRYLVKGFEDFRIKRRFIGAFAEWLSSLHGMRVYHQDMKTCNIWVSEKDEDWEYRLLDLEDVVLDEPVNENRVFRTFLQLNASIPGTITRTDRLRFLHQYLSHRFISMNRKEWVKRISEETRKRGIVYVAPWGVVKESSPPHEE